MGDNRPSGSLELGTAARALGRRLLGAAVVGAGLAPLWVAALDRAFDLRLHAWPLSSTGATPSLVLAGMLLAPVIAQAVAFIRQPGGARVSWDSWGVTEWDGAGARTAIPWSALRVGGLLIQAKARKAGPSFTIGESLTLGDDAGRRIYVSQGAQLLWLADRLASAPDLGPLAEAVADCPRMPPELGRRAENLLALAWALGMSGYALAALGLGVFTAEHSRDALTTGPLMIAGAAVLLCLRALFPLLRWRALRRESPSLGGARRITLSASEGPVLIGQDERAQPIRFDTAAAAHPDAALATRRGPGWFEPGALETEPMRRARQARARATGLEAGLRLLMAAALVVPIAAKALGGLQLGTAALGWTQVVSGYQTFEDVVAISGDGRTLAKLDHGLEVIATDTGAPITRFSLGVDDMGEALTLSPDGTRLALHRIGPGVEVVPVVGGIESQGFDRIPGKLTNKIDLVVALRFVSRGSALIGLTRFRRLFRWDLDGTEVTELVPETEDGALRLELSPDERWAVVGDVSGRVRLIELGKGRAQELFQHSKQISALAFSADGAQLASGSEDQTVHLAPLAGGAGSTLKLEEPVTAVGFAPDGRWLLVGYSGSVQVYALPSLKLAARVNLRSDEELRSSKEGPIFFAWESGRPLAALGRGGLLRLDWPPPP